MKVEGSIYSDEALVLFNPDASKGFDSDFDAYKLTGLSSAPKLYSILPTINLAVNTLPKQFKNLAIPLGFEPGDDIDYSLSFFFGESLNSGYLVYLEDLKEHKFINLLLNPSYLFTAASGDDPFRFILHFSNSNNESDPSFPADEFTGNILIYSDNNNVYVNAMNSITGEIAIYNMLGQEIIRKNMLTGLNKVNLNSTDNYYVVRIVHNEFIFTEKVLVR